jgi:hypothetical protein
MKTCVGINGAAETGRGTQRKTSRPILPAGAVRVKWRLTEGVIRTLILNYT